MSNYFKEIENPDIFRRNIVKKLKEKVKARDSYKYRKRNL